MKKSSYNPYDHLLVLEIDLLLGAISLFLYNNINLGSQTSLFVCKTAKQQKKINHSEQGSDSASKLNPFPQFVIDF